MITTIKNWLKDNPHAYAVLYFIPYVITFFTLERILTPKYIIYSPIDDLIPFSEFFIVPYFLWFPLLAVSLGYFLFNSKQEFLDLAFMMFTGMTISLILYVIFPNGLNLRVEVVNHNILADIARLLYTIDTPTNVCPSIHCSSTFAIMLVALKHKSFKKPILTKLITTIICCSIIAATMFLKQHSIIDVVCGIALTLVLAFFTYRTNYQHFFRHTPLKFIFQ